MSSSSCSSNRAAARCSPLGRRSRRLLLSVESRTAHTTLSFCTRAESQKLHGRWEASFCSASSLVGSGEMVYIGGRGRGRGGSVYARHWTSVPLSGCPCDSSGGKEPADPPPPLTQTKSRSTRSVCGARRDLSRGSGHWSSVSSDRQKTLPHSPLPSCVARIRRTRLHTHTTTRDSRRNFAHFFELPFN